MQRSTSREFMKLCLRKNIANLGQKTSSYFSKDGVTKVATHIKLLRNSRSFNAVSKSGIEVKLKLLKAMFDKKK